MPQFVSHPQDLSNFFSFFSLTGWGAGQVGLWDVDEDELRRLLRANNHDSEAAINAYIDGEGGGQVQFFNVLLVFFLCRVCCSLSHHDGRRN
eukprot:2199682-Rhodomonas_salina.1